MKSGEITAFLASAATTLVGTNEEKLEQIMNQKMVALYHDATEGWAEWRITGYPRVLVSTNESNGAISPRRWHLPPNERLVNSTNYNEAVGRMGGDAMSTKVWWDVNPAAPHKHPGTVESRSEAWR